MLLQDYRMYSGIWIRQCWEFIDEFGNLRYDLYGRRGLHLKPKGKTLMANVIKSFQKAYITNYDVFEYIYFYFLFCIG